MADDLDAAFVEPVTSDYVKAGVCLLFGALGTACEFLIPWAFYDPTVKEKPALQLYLMAFIGPGLGLVAIAVFWAMWKRFKRIRPETTPKKMLSAGLVFAIIPFAVVLAALFLWGLNSR